MSETRKRLREFIIDAETAWKDDYYSKLPDEERERIGQIVHLASARAALTCCDAIKDETTVERAVDNLTRIAHHWADKAVPGEKALYSLTNFWHDYQTPDTVVIGYEE